MNTQPEVLLSVSSLIYKRMLLLSKETPNFLKSPNVNWSQEWFTFLSKIAKHLEVFSKDKDLIDAAKQLIQGLCVPEYLSSRQYVDLISEIQQIIEPSKNLSNQNHAVLLVDAENIILDPEHEKWLEEITSTRLTIKTAFANWKYQSVDLDLHNRGYDMVHIPSGQDNADGKMISFGEKLPHHYPGITKIFICSNDNIFINLGNSLLHRGLEVFEVKRKSKTFITTNLRTKEQWRKFPPPPPQELIINQLESIVLSEQEKSQNTWIPFSRITQTYIDKHNIAFKDVVGSYLNNGERSYSFFLLHTDRFAVNKVNEEIYISLFVLERPIQSVQVKEVVSNEPDKAEKLKDQLFDILKELSAPNVKKIPISKLAYEFKSKYNLPITKALKDIGQVGTFVKFLKRYPSQFSFVDKTEIAAFHNLTSK